MVDNIEGSLGYKLRLFSKKLSSGNYQITFHARRENQHKKYGHVLVSKGSTLKEVVYMIKTELLKNSQSDLYHHGHLYSLGRPAQRNHNLVIFDQ